MTEAEALDLAAKAEGWLHWDDARQLAERGEIEIIRAHAKIIMENAALKAKNERLLDALFDAIALIGHVVPMDTTALIGGEKLTARNVWQAGHDLMFPKRTALERIGND